MSEPEELARPDVVLPGEKVWAALHAIGEAEWHVAPDQEAEGMTLIYDAEGARIWVESRDVAQALCDLLNMVGERV